MPHIYKHATRMVYTITGNQRGYFQQDGAPAHYALSVQDYRNDILLISPASLKSPARSPDLTTCDNSLWRYIKDIVS